MVVKTVKFQGPNLADRQGLFSNFICNDSDNLKFIPEAMGPVEGIAENTMRVSETNSPLWQKVLVGYKKTGAYGDHNGLIQLYGIDNLGLRTLIAEQEFNSTESGSQNYVSFDLLKSACTNSIDRMSEDTLKGYLKLSTSLLQDKYDEVKLTSPWFNKNWLYRKGIPYQNSLYRIKKQSTYDGYKNMYPSQGFSGDFWYFIIDVAYNSHMKSDFSDIRFTGPDGITLLNHWLISKTNSSTAKFLVLVPWYFGYEQAERDRRASQTKYASGSNTTNYYSNPDPRYFWMYYGNASATSSSDITLAGNTWLSDNFDDNDYSTWIRVPGNSYSTISESGTQLTLSTTSGGDTAQCVFRQLNTKAVGQQFDVVWKIDSLPANGDAAVFLSTDTTATSGSGPTPSNCIGIWVGPSELYVGQILNGVGSSWTSGTLAYNHDSRTPLYLKIHVNRGNNNNDRHVTFSASRDGVKWDDIVSLIPGTDIDANLYSNLAYAGMRRWANNAAGSIVFDWVQCIPTLQYKSRSLGFEDGFNFSEFNYRWQVFTASGRTITRNTTTKQLEFSISGDCRNEAGQDMGPKLLMPSMSGSSYDDSLRILEAKLLTHNRTSAGATRAGISFRSDANKWAKIEHQKYTSAQYDEEIRQVSTAGGTAYLKGEQLWQKEPISEGPIWFRFVFDAQKRVFIGEYSRNGIDFIPIGSDGTLGGNWADAANIMLHHANDGGGNATSTWDYIRWYDYACINDYGRTLTPEQYYNDHALLTPVGTTNIMGYEDSFEDNNLVYNEMVLKCANGQNIARTCSYDGTTNGFTSNGSTISVDSSVILNSYTNRSLKCITNNSVNLEGVYTDTFNVTPNTQYACGVWIKGTAGTSIRLGINEKNSSNTILGTTYQTVNLNGNWQYVQCTRNFGSTGEKVSIVVYTETKQAITFNISEIAFIKGSSIPAWYVAASGAGSWMHWSGHLTNQNTRTYPLRNYEWHSNYGVSGLKSAYQYDSRANANEMLAENQSTFETGVSGVTGANITVSQSNEQKRSGSYSCKMDGATTVDSYGSLGGDHASGTFRLGMQPGNFYTLTGWLYVSSAHGVDTTNGRSLRPVFFYDNGGSTRETQGPDIVVSTADLGTWKYFEFPFYIPASATSAAIRLYNYGADGTGKPIYWDDLSLKKGLRPISGTYSLMTYGNDTDDAANMIWFKDNLISKHYRIKFKQIANNSEAGSACNYHRIYAKGTNEKDTFIAVDILGSQPVMRVVKYDQKAGAVISTFGNKVFAKTTGYAPNGNTYVFDIYDDGQTLHVYRNGNWVGSSSYYSLGANGVIPGQLTGFGSNISSAALWDDLVIEPWDGTTSELNSMQEASKTSRNNGTAYDYTTTREISMMNNTYTWKTPVNFVRGQPLQVATKSNGASSYEYSKQFAATDGGWYKLGPNGLDKYIGITTRIKFVGTNNALEINSITYDYDV